MKVSNHLWCHEIDVVLAAGVLPKERGCIDGNFKLIGLALSWVTLPTGVTTVDSLYLAVQFTTE